MKTPSVELVLGLSIMLSCEKNSLPVVETVSYEIISLDTVAFIGEVTDGSGSTVVKRGFCWSTKTNPTWAGVT